MNLNVEKESLKVFDRWLMSSSFPSKPNVFWWNNATTCFKLCKAEKPWIQTCFWDILAPEAIRYFHICIRRVHVCFVCPPYTRKLLSSRSCVCVCVREQLAWLSTKTGNGRKQPVCVDSKVKKSPPSFKDVSLTQFSEVKSKHLHWLLFQQWHLGSCCWVK